MFTKEQEDYLKILADKGIAEELAIAERNAGIDLETKLTVAREAKKAELENQANQLIQEGLADFETNVVPTIK